MKTAGEKYRIDARQIREALRLASTHDPDHAKELKDLDRRVSILERQTQRIGAPQYRVVHKSKG